MGFLKTGTKQSSTLQSVSTSSTSSPNEPFRRSSWRSRSCGNRLLESRRCEISSSCVFVTDDGCGFSTNNTKGSSTSSSNNNISGSCSGGNNDSDDHAGFQRTWQRCWWLSNQIVFVTLWLLVTMSPVGLVRGEITCPPYQEIPYCSCFVLDDQLHIQVRPTIYQHQIRDPHLKLSLHATSVIDNNMPLVLYHLSSVPGVISLRSKSLSKY